MRSSPVINSSMELSPKRSCLNASSSENYITEDETEITVEQAIERFEKVTGRRREKIRKIEIQPKSINEST